MRGHAHRGGQGGRTAAGRRQAAAVATGQRPRRQCYSADCARRARQLVAALAVDLLRRVRRRLLQKRAAERVERAIDRRRATAAGPDTRARPARPARRRCRWRNRAGRRPRTTCRSRSGTARAASRGRARAAARRSPPDRACRYGRCAARRARAARARRRRARSGPAGLSTTSRPSIDRVLDLLDERSSAARRSATGDRAAGGVLVAAAAELLGDRADVDVALRPHADAVLVAFGLLEEHDRLDLLDRQRQVDQPFGVFVGAAGLRAPSRDRDRRSRCGPVGSICIALSTAPNSFSRPMLLLS